MSESNDEDYTAAIDSGSETQTEIQSVRSTNKRKSTERVSTKKKRRGMEKRVLIGSRVSAKVGKLVTNPKGAHCRRVRESVLGNVVEAVGTKKYKIQFDDGQIKDVHSNALTLEESTSGIPVPETLSPANEESMEDPDDEAEVVFTDNNEVFISESQDIIMPHPEPYSDDEEPNNAESSNSSETLVEDDDGMNVDNDINVGDINIPADVDDSNSETVLSYQNKLENARKRIKDLIGQTVEKTQNKKTMIWSVVDESVPNVSTVVSDNRDKLTQKVGFNKLLEFLYQFGYEEKDASGNSCSFESVTSSNIDRPVKSLPESTIFAELFLKLLYKDWKQKLQKMNRIIQTSQTDGNARPTKPFEEAEFLIGLGLIVGASCYCQGGSVLFSNNKDNESSWDTIIPKARFDKHMKLYRFKEFRHYLPKVYERPAEKDSDPWWQFSSAINEFNEIRNELITSSHVKVMDETMSPWRPRTSKNGGLPNISYIIRKPEPLGTEFKTVCCPITGVMTYMEIQRGKLKY